MSVKGTSQKSNTLRVYITAILNQVVEEEAIATVSKKEIASTR